MENNLDLKSFTKDSTFYGEISLLATIKSFDLQAIRKRYLASKKNNKTGSVERRKVAEGGLAYIAISNGKITTYEVLLKCNEPRGLDFHNGIFVYSTENEIHVIIDGKKRTLTNPWFSYIHTVSISENGERLLVSSSGFDVIFEYDIDTLEMTNEWWAWENGFSQGKNPKDGSPVIVSRKKLDDSQLNGVFNKVISDPYKDSLPTAMRTAFINSVEYDKNDNRYWLATFFHEGAVYRIDSESGKSTKVIDGMTSPHGGQRVGDKLMATDTRGGGVFINSDVESSRFSFHNLPNKPSELGNEEWIQNSKSIGDNMILSIDSNRTSFVIFDEKELLIDWIEYDDNLAIQDLVLLQGIEEDELEDILGVFGG